MGSVGSGVAGEQEFAMKSVGTRTTLPRGPPLSRLHAPPSASDDPSDSTATDRGQLNIASSRPSHRDKAAHRVSLDACGNVVGHGAEKNHEVKGRDGNNSKRDSRTPPKILTVSGKLEQNNSALVRPSAFKPVVPKSFHSMQNLLGQSSGGRSAGSDAPHSHINRLSSTAAPLEKPDKPSYQNGLSVSDSGQSSSGKSCLSYQRLCQTTVQPSPSTDDIIQDLEDRLWEKEQEVIHMRRNLDQSEAAIVQVFEEKHCVWERDMEELRQNYAGRLQQVTHRAQRTQQALQTHIAHLQQDKGRLQDEISALLAQREELEHKCLDYRKEQADILPRLEETKWELCQKAGEISLLKQQLRESQNEVTQRAGEMVALRGQLKELKGQMKEREETMIGLKDSYTNKSRELERCEGELKRTLTEVSMLRDKLVVFEAEVLGLKRALSELSCRSDHAVCLRDISGCSSLPWAGLHSPRSPEALPIDSFLSLQSDEAKAQRQEAGELRRKLERLQGELHLERQQRERQVLTFAQERHTWQGEKERVLKYQAQLQLSYVETLQRNQALEERVGQLGAKLGTSPGSPVSLSIPVLGEKERVLKYQALEERVGAKLGPRPGSPGSPVGLSVPVPLTADDPKPILHQLAPPWPGPTRLERIESTEI
ncbi:leucine zipper putative tumor suppressor 3-like [Sinocyclocheilus rhinocerous]|uniref:leucine zipper putative tumor suppressor 3-like n=1 Tax=Sinocyclocheilus rhinocerous TaxID=307959 RepID=UPI0007B95C1D|nr:PREDICTED: leucine zipper putative tumor suppressor 3-like [Sinocyclocheilus rhinocerous]